MSVRRVRATEFIGIVIKGKVMGGKDLVPGNKLRALQVPAGLTKAPNHATCLLVSGLFVP